MNQNGLANFVQKGCRPQGDSNRGPSRCGAKELLPPNMDYKAIILAFPGSFKVASVAPRDILTAAQEVLTAEVLSSSALAALAILIFQSLCFSQ